MGDNLIILRTYRTVQRDLPMLMIVIDIQTLALLSPVIQSDDLDVSDSGYIQHYPPTMSYPT